MVALIRTTCVALIRTTSKVNRNDSTRAPYSLIQRSDDGGDASFICDSVGDDVDAEA